MSVISWGFEPLPLHYAYWIPAGSDIPQHNPMNPKYQLLIGTWRKLPRGVVDRIGPLIVGGLG